ncbi:MAG: DUF2335 domain-containing protein [Phycisphaerae bacterium]|nr:DUF2335 domain-containing protein [Phycisphaerae bacterium]
MSKKDRIPKSKSVAVTPQDQNQITAISHTQQLRSGPIPDPAELGQYEQVLQGAADRILKMAENQSAHRQKLEKGFLELDTNQVKSENRRAYLGLIFAFCIGILGLCLSYKIIIAGHEWSGSFVGGTTLASLVGSFIYGSQKIKKDNVKISEKKD